MSTGGNAVVMFASSGRSLRLTPRIFVAIACAGLAACRYPQLPAMGGDGSATDDAGGASDSASGAPGDGARADGTTVPTSICLQHWLDGGTSLVLGQPQVINSLLSLSFSDRDPWVSSDGLRMYFSRSPGTHGGYDIYLATRASTADDFSNPMPLDNVDTNVDDNRASLSGDEKTLVFATKQQSGQDKIVITQFAGAAFPSPPASLQNLVDPINAGYPINGYYDPFLSADGLRMYLAPIPSNTGIQYLAMASRSAADQPFSASVSLGNSVNTTSGEADPALSSDERVIVFSSRRNGPVAGSNLWYAIRQRSGDAFSTPAHIVPLVNSDSDDGDPALSDDGCELYFSSARSGPAHLYKAIVQH